MDKSIRNPSEPLLLSGILSGVAGCNHDLIFKGVEMAKDLLSNARFSDNVHNFSARYSGAGNGRANFMGDWNFCVLSAGKRPCP